jgi:EmrB/QacA subfamily drug resistance transporter
MTRSAKVLTVVSAAVFVAYLDLFVVNVAFPDIGEDFPGTSLAGLSWILNAYAIVFAALLVPAGRLADLVGRKRAFVSGLALFTGASVLCAAAPSVELLVAARSLQAIGAALLLPTSLALLLVEFPPEKRAQAIGAWAAVGGVAAAAGPPIGGLLVEASWRWIFLINLPVGIAAVAASMRILRESRDEAEGRLPDLLGSAMLAAGIGALALGLVKAPDWGWGDERTLASFAASALLVAAFVYRSARHPAPVVELSLLRVRSYAMASTAALLFNAAFAAMLLGSVVFLTSLWDYSILGAAFAIAPGPITAAISSVRSPKLAEAIGPRTVATLGGFVFALGAALWALSVDASPDYLTEYLPGMILTGIGVGMVFTQVSAIAAASLPPSRFATGTAVLTMGRQIGSVLGVAVLIAVFGTPNASGLPGAVEDGFWLMAIAAAAAGLAASAIGTLQPAPAPQPDVA